MGPADGNVCLLHAEGDRRRPSARRSKKTGIYFEQEKTEQRRKAELGTIGIDGLTVSIFVRFTLFSVLSVSSCRVFLLHRPGVAGLSGYLTQERVELIVADQERAAALEAGLPGVLYHGGLGGEAVIAGAGNLGDRHGAADGRGLIIAAIHDLAKGARRLVEGDGVREIGRSGRVAAVGKDGIGGTHNRGRVGVRRGCRTGFGHGGGHASGKENAGQGKEGEGFHPLAGSRLALVPQDRSGGSMALARAGSQGSQATTCSYSRTYTYSPPVPEKSMGKCRSMSNGFVEASIRCLGSFLEGKRQQRGEKDGVRPDSGELGSIAALDEHAAPNAERGEAE